MCIQYIDAARVLHHLSLSLVERNVEPQGLPLNDPEAVAKTSQQDLVALALEIQKADSFIKANACSKLQVIADQIKSLKKQAENILLETDWNMKLHHVACNFVKHPGHVYHLYQRETEQLYFSMLSPEEWGSSGPSQIYKGAYRLEQDHTWTPLHLTDKKNRELAMLAKLFSTHPTTASVVKSIDLNVDT
ncbi:uncharacterized protein C1orf50 homolog isoform X1 [Osmia bicornis bicornis]|uniref:uncharacterized protein C1orf50 homolog isoform X1 n=1 Tax=Osmia bicornis bicornis TaxID=1437191 RepID=UPI0010F4FE14|nr:uncharacterized protein C1orf50 homolog isoform X1 [Osmia bicornis bicornis]XP_029050752.1 uncharacterized protein C1orf50 homolog isoform X1 [Osmia bicornis bicornis]XP_029050753.1 uncharacterized protein C1orf50 homolog isoform X1 [Osmia bicornis bicornis]XP_029050754.1 uncharacterized protein C1orf50 homolog isoform X1 [Osmia bicornis bicornis]